MCIFFIVSLRDRLLSSKYRGRSASRHNARACHARHQSAHLQPPCHRQGIGLRLSSGRAMPELFTPTSRGRRRCRPQSRCLSTTVGALPAPLRGWAGGLAGLPGPHSAARGHWHESCWQCIGMRPVLPPICLGGGRSRSFTTGEADGQNAENQRSIH